MQVQEGARCNPEFNCQVAQGFTWMIHEFRRVE